MILFLVRIFQPQAESKAILMPQQKILIDVLFYWKMDWLRFLWFSWKTLHQLDSFQQAPERILHFSGFFFQVKEVLPYLFQLEPNQIRFSVEIFWQVLELVRDSRWNGVCRMYPEDQVGIPGCKEQAPGSNALMLPARLWRLRRFFIPFRIQ